MRDAGLTATTLLRCLLGETGLTLAVVPPLGGQQGAAPPPPLVRENVTSKVAAHTYVIPDGNVGLVPNVGIVVGSRATLVIDMGLGPKNGEAVMREVRKVSQHTELYLATTHFHPEHDLGASAFPSATTVIRAKAQVQDIEEYNLELARTSSRAARRCVPPSLARASD